ncbi:MAG: rod shape-determining protein MreC [Sporomusaceae bacterium]|nr:rod shape-determining protein MreC [Sporomusaceae bacterium]
MRFFGKKTIVLVVILCTILLLASASVHKKFQFSFMDQALTTVLSPFEYVFSQVGYGIRHTVAATTEIFTVYQENQRLKSEIEASRQQNADMTEITAENDRLKLMLDYKKQATQFDLVAATVIARDPGTWTSIIVINKGTNDGLTKDMPVVTPQGLVGNVVQVFGSTAKVQLLLDPRSAVGALNQRSESRVAGIVEGSGANHNAPRMVNLSRDADIVAGDHIVTSGFGGLYPKGISVGDVIDIANDEGGLLKYAVLKPAVDFDRLEEVFIIVHSREPIPVLPSVKPNSASGTTAADPTGKLSEAAKDAAKGAVKP